MFWYSSLHAKEVLSKKRLQSYVVREFTFFWTSKCFVWLEIISLLKLITLVLKWVSLSKSTYYNLATNISAVNLSNSDVVKYLV